MKTAKKHLWLIEYYTTNGNEIRFAWVGGDDAADAITQLSNAVLDDSGRRVDFEETITCSAVNAIVPLKLSGNNSPRFVNTSAFQS